MIQIWIVSCVVARSSLHYFKVDEEMDVSSSISSLVKRSTQDPTHMKQTPRETYVQLCEVQFSVRNPPRHSHHGEHVCVMCDARCHELCLNLNCYRSNKADLPAGPHRKNCSSSSMQWDWTRTQCIPLLQMRPRRGDGVHDSSFALSGLNIRFGKTTTVLHYENP